MLNPFYTKSINIYNHSSYIDANGITRSGYNIALENIKCDMQPIGAEKVQNLYGYDLNITKQIFLDIIPELSESSIIQFNNDFYKIEKIIEWDNYLQVGVSKK